MKKYSFRAGWLVIVILFLFPSLHSQTSSDPGGFRHITVRDGLPSSEVYKIIQDHLGYLWMCTDAGVCRYNGYHFQSFTTRDGLTDNTVFRMKEDNQQRMWAQGFSGALSYFDGERFNPIPANDSLISLYNNGQKNSFCMEMDANGGVVIGGLYTHGLFRISPEDKYKTPHAFNPPAIGDEYKMIWSKTEGKENVYAYMENFGQSVSFYHNGVQTTIDLSSIKFPPTNYFAFETHNGKILFSFYNRLYSIEENGNFEVNEFPANIIGIDEDFEKNIWVSIFLGGTYFCPQGNFNNKRAHYLPGKSVSCVFEDNEKGFWFSTVGDGIYYLPDIRFGYLTPSEGLSEPNIQSISAFEKHAVVIGLPKGTISIFNPIAVDENKLSSSQIPSSLTLATEAIISIHDTILSSSSGIFIMDSSLKVLDTFNNTGHFKGVIRNPINGDFMFYSHVSFMWMNKKLVIDSFQLTKVRFTAACYGKDGTIWLGALNGLWKLKGNQPVYLGDSVGGIKARIDGISEDKNGTLWIATRGEGVFAISGKQRWHFGEAEGMAANTCRAITIDEVGRIWVGTNHGITLIKDFDAKTGKANLRSFNTTHGLLSNEVKFILCHDGKLWMGSNGGLCWITIHDLTSDSVPPPVYITAVRFGNDTIRLDTTAAFDFSDNTIRIFVEGICFRDPDGIRYRYRLFGGDEKWITTANRELNFSGLSPGVYRLEIVAVNSDGVESNHPAVFQFRIIAPFWRTWWFLVLVILAFSGLLFLFISYRLKAKQKRVKDKIETEKRIAELRLNALRAQMNPHFIFNAINSIQHFVLQNDSEQAYNYLSKFSRLIRLVLDQSQSEAIPLDQELKMLNLYIALEQLRFERPFTYDIKVDAALEDGNIRIPGMLVQPFVENAIWHGLLPKKTGDAWIKIAFRKKEKYVEIIIEDNGVGRIASTIAKQGEAKHRSYGLQITEERLRLAEYENSNEPVIQIADLKDPNGNPTGTKVEIHLALEEDE